MKKHMTRREFLSAASIASGAGILAACAPAAAPAADKPTAAPVAAATATVAAPAASDAVTIVFTGWGGTEEDEGVKSAVKYFESQTPNIKVNWIQIPDSYAPKILAMIAAGTPPDNAFCDNGTYGDYVKRKLLMDITDQIKADKVIGAPGYFIEPQESNRCVVNGKWYGIGSCWVAAHIYYNNDVFKKAGITPPSNDPDKAWDWAQFLDVARKLTVDTKGNHPGDTGFDKDNIESWGVQWPQNNLVYLDAAVADNGGSYLDPKTNLLAIDSPAATEGLQNIADLMLKENVAPRGSAVTALGLTNTQMLESGKLAMAVDGSWALSWITKIKADLGTATLPKMKSLGTDMQAHIHVALAATKHPEAAWQWERFLATEYYQLQFCKTGLWLPSQTALMTPEGIKKWYTERKAPGEGVHPVGYDLIITKFVSKYGKVLYLPPGYPEASQIITPALDKVWVGDATAAEALGTAVPEANKVLTAAMSS
jgi:multiple sugar transport system substrate-binding protein